MTIVRSLQQGCSPNRVTVAYTIPIHCLKNDRHERLAVREAELIIHFRQEGRVDDRQCQSRPMLLETSSQRTMFRGIRYLTCDGTVINSRKVEEVGETMLAVEMRFGFGEIHGLIIRAAGPAELKADLFRACSGSEQA